MNTAKLCHKEASFVPTISFCVFDGFRSYKYKYCAL